MRLDRHMQYRVSQLSEHLVYLPAHVTNFFLGRKCVELPHMTKGHVCAPQTFQRKPFQSIFPTHMGPKYWGTQRKNSPHFHILHSWILDFATDGLKPCASTVLPCIYIQGPSSWDRISKQAMRHDLKRQITLAVCYKTTETATTKLHTMCIT